MRIFSGLQKPDAEGARKAEDPTFEWIFFLICKILEAGEGRKVQPHTCVNSNRYHHCMVLCSRLFFFSLAKA